MTKTKEGEIAYFSMEIGLVAKMPTYAGGLGVLAGDTIRSAADLKLPMVAISLVYRKGYLNQTIDRDGQQHENAQTWVIEDFLKEKSQRVSVLIEGRTVYIRAWQYRVKSDVSGFSVPVYFLDTDLPGNSTYDRTITDSLYGGNERNRLCQEIVLGIGGIKMLRELGYLEIEQFHMNEGHASLLIIALLDEQAIKAGRNNFNNDDVDAIKPKCVFTTHTPVPAGYDQFSLELVSQVLGKRQEFLTVPEIFYRDGVFNLINLALNVSHYINGVSLKHADVAQRMFSNHKINAITNGVHAVTWTSDPMQALFDKYIPGWRGDYFSLRGALNIPKPELEQAHLMAKKSLIEYVASKMNINMDIKIFTLGFSRRATAYKRDDLIFEDMKRLKKIVKTSGAIQIIYAGKAHPNDLEGKELIKRIYHATEALKNVIKIVYLPNHDMALGKMMTSGVDLWLNTPQPPMEASGTSGMKAALNGIPSLSILDGWWIEGCIEGVTGWAVDSADKSEPDHDSLTDYRFLYEKLEKIIPIFYKDQNYYLEVMRHSIAINGVFFNTQRMLQQYVVNAYFC